MTEVAPDDNANGDRPPPELANSQQSLDEADFITDRDLNWLCGYEEGQTGDTASCRQQQRCPELLDSRSYNQLSCQVDATLAAIDMEQFCRADIDKILEISAYSSDLYGEQGLFSNISMDSLDCSSIEAEECLHSLEADDSSSAALPITEDDVPTSEEHGAETSSDAAAATTSGEVALITSDDATDSATMPIEFRPSPLTSTSPTRTTFTSRPNQRQSTSPVQQRTTWPEHHTTPSPPPPVGHRTTWQEQCHSPQPSVQLTREAEGTRVTTTWRQQCLPPSPPVTPEPEIVEQRQMARPSGGAKVVGVCTERTGSIEQVEARRSEDGTKSPQANAKMQSRCDDLRRQLLRNDKRNGQTKGNKPFLETPPTKSPEVQRRNRADSPKGSRREVTNICTGRCRGHVKVVSSELRPVASAAPTAVVDRGCQTTPASGNVCVFPDYTLPGLPFLEHSPITIPNRHSSPSGNHRVQISSSSNGSQRMGSPAPGGSSRTRSPSLAGSRGTASPSPLVGNSPVPPGSPALSARGSVSSAAGEAANSIGSNGRHRVNSPLLAGTTRVNSPIPTGRLTPTVTGSPQRRPYSCNDIRTVIRGNMSAIRDWRSLRMLLPQEFRSEVDRLSGDPGSPDGPSGLHVGQCRSASSQGSSDERRERSDRTTDAESDGRSTPGSAKHPGLTSGSSTGSGKTLDRWFCDAADFAATNQEELGEFTSLEETPMTKFSKSHSSSSSSRSRSKQTGSGKTSVEGPQRHVSVDSGIEMRMPASFGRQHSGGSDNSRSAASDSQARRVIVVHKDGFEETLSLITESVSAIVAYFKSSAISLSTNEPVGGRLVGDSRRSPAVGYLVLDRLCPALYSLLGDGLLTHLSTAFGPVHNSVWRLVESVCTPGICPQPLSDLVLKVNNEEELSESVLRFNAFLFGLLNMQALDWWFSYLLTRQQPVLVKHYAAEALLRQLSRADTERLLHQLRPLVRLGFAIELTFESQLLRQSLWRLGRRLTEFGGTEQKRNRPKSAAAEEEKRTAKRSGKTGRGSPTTKKAQVTAAAILGKLERRLTGGGVDRELMTVLTEALSGCLILDRDENDNASVEVKQTSPSRAKQTSPKPGRSPQGSSEPKTKPRSRGHTPARTVTPPQPNHPGQRSKKSSPEPARSPELRMERGPKTKPKIPIKQKRPEDEQTQPQRQQQNGRLRRPKPEPEPELHSEPEPEPEPKLQSEPEPELQSEPETEPEPEPEVEPEQEPAITRQRTRQLEEWWQRVTRDQRSEQLQAWWERQPEQTSTAASEAGMATAAVRRSPDRPFESRVPRRVSSSGRPRSTPERHIAPSCSRQSLASDAESMVSSSAAGTKRKRPTSEASLRLRLLKRDREIANCRDVAESARRAASQQGARGAGAAPAANRAPEKRQGKRVRSLVPYHTPNRNFLSYERNDTLTVVGTTDDHWLLCARDEQIGLVTRHHVTNVT